MSTNFITLALSASLQIFTWDTKQLAYFESPVSTNFTTPAEGQRARSAGPWRARDYSNRGTDCNDFP